MTHDEMVYADQQLTKALAKLRKALRTAVADYMSSEGCGCCQGAGHDLHARRVAKLLNVPEYSDGSGYNFAKFKTPRSPR